MSKIKLFKKSKENFVATNSQRGVMGKNLILPDERADYRLYDALREAVPIIDAAVTKTVRLTGGFKVICSDERYQRLVAGILPQEVANAVAGIKGVGKVEVKVVWEPAWTTDRLSEEAKAMLDMF